MRSDMDKVVTERPRYGHANRSKKTGLKINRVDPNRDYDTPKRLSSSKGRQYGWDAKEFSDRIGPLKRFLRSQVGRHWGKVYSELSEVLDKRSLTGRHIWVHIRQEVKVDCLVGADGKIYSDPRYEPWYPVKGLYVHPRTRILSYAK